MKLRKENKKLVIRVLKRISKLVEIDSEMYDMMPDGVVKDKEEYVYYEWYKCQDIVFQLMAGTTGRELNEIFGTPGNIGQKPKRPVAWYKTDFNISDEKYIVGPKSPVSLRNCNYQGYIPDKMVDIIVGNGIKAKDQYELLETMMKDLIKIKKEFKRG